MNVGTRVNILPPFSFSFPDVYTITDIVQAEDGQDVYFLEGVEGGWALSYLEEAK